jgi:hypothetical protein
MEQNYKSDKIMDARKQKYCLERIKKYNYLRHLRS